MLRPELTRRCTATASLLLHLLVLAVLPLAHARLEAAEPRQAVHIEDGRNHCCAPPHDALTCEICRTLRAPSRTPVVHTIASAPLTAPFPAILNAAPAPAQLAQLLHIHSRAPPRLHS